MTAQTFRYPIGAAERKSCTLYDSVMRAFGRVPYVARAQGARFVVDTTDLIDREIAINAIWEAEQLEDFATICRTQTVDCFLDIGANAGVYSVMLAIQGSRRRDHSVRTRSRKPRTTSREYRGERPAARKFAWSRMRSATSRRGRSDGGGPSQPRRSPGSRIPTSRRKRRRGSPPMWCGKSASTTRSRSSARPF